MKKYLIFLTILIPFLPCMADETYRSTGYWGNKTIGCYEKMCNSYNCYDKEVSCYSNGYMKSKAREGIAQTLMFNLGRYPTEQEIDAAFKELYGNR